MNNTLKQIREALEESWKIVYSSCVMCDKRTCPLGKHSEQPQCNRFPNEDRECHIKQSIIKSNQALLTLQGKVIVDGWQPIETAPKDGTEILVCNMRQGGVQSLIYWYTTHSCWKSKGIPVHLQATHWMPIPDAPNLTKEDSDENN